MVTIKVDGGTAQHGEDNLCGRCNYYQEIITRNGQDFRRCNCMERRLVDKVVSCNKFSDASKPSLYDMQQIAWVVTPETKKGPVGFMTPAEYRQKHRSMVDVPGYD